MYAMEYDVVLHAATIPEFPVAATPAGFAGHETVNPYPGAPGVVVEFQDGDVSDRYCVKMKVSPLESCLWIGMIV